MHEDSAEQLRRKVDDIYRADSRRVFATLIRLLGDFDLAEDALHDAFAAAMAQWARDGLPANPRAWLVSAGRFKAIDDLRGFSVSLLVDTPAEAERIFHALSENGSVCMPMEQTFWAVRFGMLVDRFGISWMINCEKAA